MHRMSGFDNVSSEAEQHMQQQPHTGANRDNRRNYGNRSDGQDRQYQSYNRNARDRNDDRQYRGRGPPAHRSSRHDQKEYDEYEPNYQSKFTARFVVFITFINTVCFFRIQALSKKKNWTALIKL